MSLSITQVVRQLGGVLIGAADFVNSDLWGYALSANCVHFMVPSRSPMSSAGFLCCVSVRRFVLDFRREFPVG